MQRRMLLSIAAIGASALFSLGGIASAAPPEEKTVTLEITGMTWASCASTVRSALEKVEGVKNVEVKLDDDEAVVTYDAGKVKPEDLVNAVKNARGMSKYDAKVKEGD